MDNSGNISQDNTMIYILSQVLETNKAVYSSIDLQDTYVPGLYQTDTLYLGEGASTVSTVDFSTVKAFAVKVY